MPVPYVAQVYDIALQGEGDREAVEGVYFD